VKVIGYTIGELRGWSTGGGGISRFGPLGMVHDVRICWLQSCGFWKG